jgi:hypothetical protein
MEKKTIHIKIAKNYNRIKLRIRSKIIIMMMKIIMEKTTIHMKRILKKDK